MSKNPKLCSIGDPCWDGYVFIGPEPNTKGSCISVSNLCKKKTSRAK